MNAQLRQLLLDLGPLVAFFVAFQFFGIYVATGTFMVLVVVSLIAGYAMNKKFSPIALFSAAVVLVFGGLTLYLKNDLFLKIKPTIIYSTFAVVLLGGLAFNRLFIKYVLAFEFEMPESAWRALTWRWGLFFVFLASLNEAVWRNFSTAQWVFFKAWITLPLVVLFGALQAPMLMKHMPDDDKAG
ncbi:MAG TPA: septation protein A [Rhizomicrobium sp.]|jgi:intracellular septation protein|nr:septation protein A [Rhizomicrobium sp.]